MEKLNKYEVLFIRTEEEKVWITVEATSAKEASEKAWDYEQEHSEELDWQYCNSDLDIFEIRQVSV